jgi:AcrR family transcriptional regulator
MVKQNGLSKSTGRKARNKASRGSSRPAKRADSSQPGAGDSGDSEARILAAARKEFISKGLDGARMQAIAAEAGVNKALLHYYYRSKERLYRTVVEDTLKAVWDRIQAGIEDVGDGGGLEPILRTLVTTYIRTLAAHPEFPLFMLRELSTGGAMVRKVVGEMGSPLGDAPGRLMQALRAEVREGRAREVPPMHFLMNVMGMCVVTFLARPMIESLGARFGAAAEPGARYLDARIESIVDMALDGIRPGGR